jgi:hypothetical protein
MSADTNAVGTAQLRTQPSDHHMDRGLCCREGDSFSFMTPRDTRLPVGRSLLDSRNAMGVRRIMPPTRARLTLGPDLYMAAVFDAFARARPRAEVLARNPRACHMARLFKRTVRAFAEALKCHGVLQRHASKVSRQQCPCQNAPSECDSGLQGSQLRFPGYDVGRQSTNPPNCALRVRLSPI